MKKTWKALAGTVLAASLVIAPMVTAGAAAAEAPLEGKVGDAGRRDERQNAPGYWEKRFAEFDATCYSHQGNRGSDHGSIADNKKTVTLKTFNQDWPGDHWVVLVVKAGNTNNVIVNPEPNVAYASPLNSGGKQADVSHWIVCKGTTPPPAAEPVTPTLAFTPPTCLAEGVLTRSNNVDWTEVKNADGTSVWKAVARTGFVLAAGAKSEWTVPDLKQLLADNGSAMMTSPKCRRRRSNTRPGSMASGRAATPP